MMLMKAGASVRQVLEAKDRELIAQLEQRIASLGGLDPVPRNKRTAEALAMIVAHVGLVGWESAGTLTPQGVHQVAIDFTNLWLRSPGKVVALIPVKEETDERLN